jgi:hypothetical protein
MSLQDRFDRQDAAVRAIERYQRTMKEGMRCEIDRDQFEMAFPPMDYNGARWTSADRFMENQIGSSYGSWRVWFNAGKGTYTIERGKLDETRRVWTSPDRRDRVAPQERGESNPTRF